MARKRQRDSLSRTQERALASLVVQPTVPLAAREARVSERTVYRWLAGHDAFKAEYARLRREVVNDAINMLQKFSTSAARNLVTMMNDRECPSSVRLGAARTVLELSLDAIRVEILEQRIVALEERLAQLGETAHQNGTVVTARWLPTG